MPRTIVLPIDGPTSDALVRLAAQEERPVKSQALVLIKEALIERGELVVQRPRLSGLPPHPVPEEHRP